MKVSSLLPFVVAIILAATASGQGEGCGAEATALRSCLGTTSATAAAKCSRCSSSALGDALQFSEAEALSRCERISGDYCKALAKCGADNACDGRCGQEWSEYAKCSAGRTSAVYGCGQDPCNLVADGTVAAAQSDSTPPPPAAAARTSAKAAAAAAILAAALA